MEVYLEGKNSSLVVGPFGAKALTSFQLLNGTTEEVAEKVDFGAAAPKGACDFKGLAVSLKRYPDTNRSFSAACKGRALPVLA
jgi:hypothetical protein